MKTIHPTKFEKNCHSDVDMNLLTKLVLVVAFVLSFSTVANGAVANMQQSFELKPGWNAIYVELEPNQNRIEDIFSGIPIKSVWRWIPDKLGGDFIQDPAEGLLSVDGWFGYFPEPRPEAFLTNLYTITANTAYLVYLDDNTNRNISISGKPVFKGIRWRPNGFTLTGLPVDSSQSPSFADYFSLSQAHQGQPIYRLTEAGAWEQVSNPLTETIKSGEAYWIYTEGNSSYTGLINIKLQQGESLEYRTMFTELDFMISNSSDVTNFIRIDRVGGVSMPMKFLNVDTETGEEAWPVLPASRILELAPGEDQIIKFAVDRTSFTEERMEQIFSISNEQGVRYLLHAGANTIQPLALPTRNMLKRGITEVPMPEAGLWAGTVQVLGVSEAQRNGVEPTPVGKPFAFRVLIHVDATGTARLLKNVVQMWQEGTYTPSATNPEFLEVDVPGNYVLITDDSLIPNYAGISVRNGQLAGLRYSTIGYDFLGDELEMAGEFSVASSLTASLLVDSDLPTNPFYHKYHPDHDNLDAQFLNFKQEAFQVTREMQFQFSPNNPRYPEIQDPPSWGSQQMGGVFRESISGLHKNTIFIEGEFRLQRVAATAVLNQ
ncbi:hypothetical protein OS175_09260 [Marinicella sp. S1101]|uniref:hypothetical protein n=1 Tax=Marinicella marina TaxID=2996016 RepID=UPI002260F78B|nr:hypothetical protein [Marinicella marina]MCX7554065.1 hypothetical protein [Marinicella marina]MDJ1141242.1 hypothetical protein [Marinicella marina]